MNTLDRDSDNSNCPAADASTPIAGDRPGVRLQEHDQKTLFCLLVLAAVALAAFVVLISNLGFGLVQADRAVPLRADYQIDINTAPWTEFTQLPNIGETLARAIVEFREQRGDLLSLNDLKQVRGISDKTIAGIRKYVSPSATVASPRVDGVNQAAVDGNRDR